MQYKLVMFMSRVCCCLPHGLLMAAGWVLGNLYYLLIKKQRERAVAQMMPALGVDEARARQLVKESFVNLARNVLEILYMPALTKENFSKYVEIDHLERMEEALAEGKGVVVLTGHIGTWEWLSAAFTMNDMPVTAIAKPQPNIQYTNALDDLRKTINVQIFSRGTSELMAAARALGSTNSALKASMAALRALYSVMSVMSSMSTSLAAARAASMAVAASPIWLHCVLPSM